MEILVSLVLIIPFVIIIYFYYLKTVPALAKKNKLILIFLRSLAAFLLLILLFNPIIGFWRTSPKRPEVVILVDNSYSMDLDLSGQSKTEINREYLTSIKPELKRNDYEVTELNFADGIEGNRSSSNLTRTLQNLSERTNLSNVEKLILLSDGWFNDEQLDVVDRLRIPIWTVHPDYQEVDFDVGINRLIHNPTAYTDEDLTITADVYAENYQGNADLELYIDDELVDKKVVDFSENSIRQVSFEHSFALPGLARIRAEIQVKDNGEFNSANNVYPGAIRVIDKRAGTYIVTDKLQWDVRFINLALRRDDRKDVKVFTNKGREFLSGKDIAPYESIFPEHLQLLIICNYGGLNFDSEQVELLQRFVGNSGGLLFIGKPIPEIEELLAVSKSTIDNVFRGTFSLTEESNKYRTFSAVNPPSIPPVEYLYISPLVHAEILGRFNNDEQSPAIIYHSFQQGRVVYLPFFNLWRWQLHEGDSGYNRLIDNLASWLANPSGMDFVAQSDKNSYLWGEDVTIKLSAYDETLVVDPNLQPQLQLFDGEDTQVVTDYMNFDYQNYSLILRSLSPGNYTYEISEERTDKRTAGEFIVSELDAESRNRGYNFSLLSFLSRHTGGSILRDDEVADYRAKPADVTTERVRVEIPIYRHWVTATLFLLAFCLELYLRKKWGLL
jgi:hypothetical protein